MATVPMFAPNGATGEIPVDKVQAAAQAGFKPAYEMTAPDGKTLGYIPADKLLDAQNAGFKMAGKGAGTHVAGVNGSGNPIFAPDDQPPASQQYKSALFNPVGSGANAYPAPVEGALQVGGRAMQNIFAPIAHPIDTLTGLANSVLHPEDTANARIAEFKQEWQKSPALALENAAGDLLGMGEGGRLGSAALSKAADAAGPIAGRAVLLGKTPEAAYESALKPSTTISAPQRANIVQTGLEKGIPVSKAGAEKIGDLIDQYNDEIKNTINSAGPDRTISPGKAAQNLASVRSKFATQVNPTADMNAIDASGNEFLNQFRSQPGGAVRNMTASEAQAMKQGTYRVLAGKYGEQGSAAVEAQKALARGLKEEIANQFPEITKLNADESNLLNLQPVLERAVNRISNHQLIGIGTPVAGAAAKAVTGSGPIGAAVATLKAVLDNPMVKSRLAIAVSKGGKIPYSQALARVGAYSAALGAATGQSLSAADHEPTQQPNP